MMMEENENSDSLLNGKECSTNSANQIEVATSLASVSPPLYSTLSNSSKCLETGRNNASSSTSALNRSRNGMEVHLGDRVCTKSGKYGIVAYQGTPQFAEGIWVGVLLDKPLGKNNGSISGTFYFKAKPHFGCFVRVSNVTVLSSSDSLVIRSNASAKKINSVRNASSSLKMIETQSKSPSSILGSKIHSSQSTRYQRMLPNKKTNSERHWRMVTGKNLNGSSNGGIHSVTNNTDHYDHNMNTIIPESFPVVNSEKSNPPKLPSLPLSSANDKQPLDTNNVESMSESDKKIMKSSRSKKLKRKSSNHTNHTIGNGNPSISRTNPLTPSIALPPIKRDQCARCGGDIGIRSVEFEHKIYHLRCFVCVKCKKTISGATKFFEKDGEPYCILCRPISLNVKNNERNSNPLKENPSSNMRTCVKCGQIALNGILFAGKKWHGHCFVCTHCGKRINKQVFEMNGLPFCLLCNPNDSTENLGSKDEIHSSENNNFPPSN